MSIYFVTNRNPLDNVGNEVAPSPLDHTQITTFGKKLSSSGLSDLRFGYLNTETNTKNIYPTNNLDGSFGSISMFNDIKTQMIAGRDTVIYIHGFNTSFDDALNTGKEILANLNNDVNLVVFTWPSDGQTLHYFDDREDAQASSLSVARGLFKLTEYLKSQNLQCNRKIHLICHSMGVYVLRNALQKLKSMMKGSKYKLLFNEVILAAADEDNDSFEYDYKLLPLCDISQRITVYFNNGDQVLLVSDTLKANPQRLGQDGPRYPRNVASNLVLVDVSSVDIPAFPTTLSHSYYVHSNIVSTDLYNVINGTPSEKISFNIQDNIGTNNLYNRTYVPHANKFRLEQM